MPVALLSVTDKSGLVEFGSALIDLGWDLLASGGTAHVLETAGLPVMEISAYTGSPEILGGRVKTLHPAVHAGLLARRTDSDRDELTALGGREIDLVAVNLYPFRQTVLKPGADLAAALENIDIGGVALLRAAAKNYEHVLVLSDPEDYSLVIAGLKSGEMNGALRRRLAYRAFAHTAAYDAAIAGYFRRGVARKRAGQDAAESGSIPCRRATLWREPTPISRTVHLRTGGWPIGRGFAAGQTTFL